MQDEKGLLSQQLDALYGPQTPEPSLANTRRALDVLAFLHSTLSRALLDYAFPHLTHHYLDRMWDEYEFTERDVYAFWHRLSKDNKQRIFQVYLDMRPQQM